MRKLKNYEVIFMVRQDAPAAYIASLAESYKQIIQKEGGDVLRIEYDNLRSLAYRIKKNRKAHYMLMYVKTGAAALHEVERQMRLNESVLRYLTVRVESFPDGPSPLAQSRPAREFQDRPEGARQPVEEGVSA